MHRPWYATTEQLARAPDIKETARAQVELERAADAASRSVDGDLQRSFYPEIATREFTHIGWNPRSCRHILFLDRHELIELDTLSVDGTAVDAANLVLRPQDGPPFNRIEFTEAANLRTGSADVQATGTWGNDDRTAPAGQLAAAIGDTSTTTVDVTNAAAVGIGDLLTLESERVIVTGKDQLDTGHNLADSLNADLADTAVAVTDGTAFATGEVLLVDNERMLVVDIAGNELTVRRAFDGSTLTAHSIGADIFASRRLTVERGVLGTTAATHLVDTPIARQVYPGPVVSYTVALGLQELLGEQSGYGREIAVSGAETQAGGRGLDLIRDDARRSHRRPFLVR